MKLVLNNFSSASVKLTVNMKCFEIDLLNHLLKKLPINRKHEMFWNAKLGLATTDRLKINRKHEMFWNELEAMTLEEIEKINRKHEMFWNWYDLFKKDVWNIN